MTREMMLDEVIRRYGFEVKQTIKFATLCESGTDEKVQAMYNKLMKQAEMPTAPFFLGARTPEAARFLLYHTCRHFVKRKVRKILHKNLS